MFYERLHYKYFKIIIILKRDSSKIPCDSAISLLIFVIRKAVNVIPNHDGPPVKIHIYKFG